MSRRAHALAERIEQGAQTLFEFAEGLSDSQWTAVCPGDGRTVGVLVHHVASVYPAEIDLVRVLASGQAIAGVTWDMVHQMNAKHAQEHAKVSKHEALELLQKNSKIAADAVRELADEQLDRSASVSLNWDAPLTAQYFIEEHPLSHSFRHLTDIHAALKAEVGK